MTKQEFNHEVVSASFDIKPYALKLAKNQTDAEDLLQEAISKALHSRDKFKEGTNLSAWLYTIMKNIFINQYRRKKNHQVVFDDSDNGYLLHNTQTDFNRGETNLTIRELEEALAKLEETYRKPLLMHNEGYKYKEIAEEIDVPIGTVKSRIFAGRKKLRSRLA